MHNNRLLLIDTNRFGGSEAADYFRENGYETVLHTGYAPVRRLLSHGVEGLDLILFFTRTPDVEGYQIIEMIREAGDLAIIMITGDERLESQLYAYSKGIDEVLTGPVPLPLLDAHIEAVLRRKGERRVPFEQEGALSVDHKGRKVYLDGKPLHVTAKEFDLLVFFLRHKGMVLTRDKILDSVWGFDYVGSYRNVDTLIKKLRAKLTKDYPYIKTIYGIGYSFDI